MSAGNIENLINLLMETKTPTGENSKQAIERAAEHIDSAGTCPIISSFKDEQGREFYNMVAEKGDHENTITLIGHLDVVPVSFEEQWSPRRIGDWLYGRGAADAKGPAAIATAAFIDSSEERLENKVRLVLTTDEEIGGEYGAKKILDSYGGGPDDFLIAFEPFGGLVNQHYGLLWITAHAFGKAEHTYSAKINPLNVLRKFENEALEYLSSCSGSSIFSPNYSQESGSRDVMNQVPDKSIRKYDTRTSPELGVEKVFLDLKAIADSLNVNLSVECKSPSLDTDPENRYIRKFIDVGYDPKKVGASTDAKWANCPAVVFGPLGSGLHSEDERLYLPSIGPTYQAIINFLENK